MRNHRCIFSGVLISLVGGLSTASSAPVQLSAIIDASQESPAPTNVPAGAGGFATVTYDDVTKELSWDIAWQNLSGDAAGMHFHGPAQVGESAGVQLGIDGISGATSPSMGSAVISDTFASELTNGLWYINIHTAENPPGEIRGQVKQNVLLSAAINPDQETPTPTNVPAGAGGSATIAFDPDTNTLGWNIQWHDLSGPVTGMHFHAPAPPGVAAGVQVNIGNNSGLTSPSIGSTVISNEFASQLLDDLSYINIHTGANPPGEIRGQVAVVPEPNSIWLVFAATMLIGCRFWATRLPHRTAAGPAR